MSVETETNTESIGSFQRQLAGKYLSFFLSKEEYGVDILRVREIIGVISMTEIPKSPGYVKGVMNLRGKIIPVVDLRLKFGMEEAPYTDETCIVVIELESEGDNQSRQMGCIVDTVSEVMEVDAARIEGAPRCSKVNSEFVSGVGKLKDRVLILLDIEKTIRSVEVNDFGEQPVGAAS